MTTGIFLEAYNQFAPLKEKYDKIGRNTGNILFMSALRSILDCEIVRDWEADKIASCDRFVTTELIWLQEGVRPSISLLKKIEQTKGKPLVPISIGLQCDVYKPDFRFAPEMLAAMEELASRCCLAVRGGYTAEILNKYGIKNIEIVGCPSVYQLPLYHSSFDFLAPSDRVPDCVSGNYRSLVGKLNDRDVSILRHIATNCSGFVEQTLASLSETNVKDADLIRWFTQNSHMFFDLESWVRHDTRYDFSYGLRFHGNVAALLAGVPALFVVIDSRTREMTDHFRFPTIEMADFSGDVGLDVLRAKADYGLFTKTFGDNLSTFVAYLGKNGLPLSKAFAKSISDYTAALASPKEAFATAPEGRRGTVIEGAGVRR